MDFRTALIWLSNHFNDASVERLINAADSLVFSTAPLTVDKVCSIVYDPDKHTDKKIAFIRDVRVYSRDHGLVGLGLKECKEAVERFNAELSAHEDWTWNDEDTDANNWRAEADWRERTSEQGSWFGAPGPMDEEPF